MCGIFGISTVPHSKLSPKKIGQIINSLFLLSESRGKEASGVVGKTNDSLMIYKAPSRAHAMLKQSGYKKVLSKLIAAKPISIIGHSRLETNGTHLLNKNNQPIMTTNLVGIHNGICTNYQQLWKKLKIKPKTELDTEAMFAFVENQVSKGLAIPQALASLYTTIEGSATLAAYHSKLNNLLLATNTGSLFYLHAKGNYFIFSSEKYILETVGKRYNLPISDIQQLKPNYACILDLASLKDEIVSLKKASLKGKNTLKLSKKAFKIIDFSPTTKSASPLNSFLNSQSVLENHQPNYNAINKLRRCKKCILPETMPLISFDDKGICNYCHNHNPISYEGQKSLEELVAPFRKNDGSPDCIVAFSGGRDSSYGLHYLKTKLGLNPIAYTYDWGMITDLGRRNQARMVGKLGVEHIIVSADIKRKRENIRSNILAWLKKPDLGMVPLFMAGDKQAEYYAEELKRKTGIKLVFYCRGNELENEEFKWGHCGISNGSPKGVLHNLSIKGKFQLAWYYGTQFLTNPSYLNKSLIDTAFAFAVAYLMPLDFVYLWHYIPWDEKRIVTTLQKNYNWEIEDNVSWRIDDGSVAFYNYIFYKMQGFTENDTFRSNQVREGILTRNQALRLANQENKPRHSSLKWYFDTLNLNGDEVLSTIDSVAAY